MPNPNAPEITTRELKCGESVPNPSSTKRRIHGPAIVQYRTWDDGMLEWSSDEPTREQRPDLYCGGAECGACHPEL